MLNIITSLFLLLNTLATKNYFNFKKHPDVELTINQLVTKYGYPLETHKIVTSDGYHLKTYRIPHGTNSNKTNPYPVLLGHGTCGCSENFLVFGPTKSLGYFLADRGFDVWLMNFRGNFHSRDHDFLNPDTDKKFWDFSFHEAGVVDLAENIDYILRVINKTKLAYVGHSQGTTNYFALVTNRIEYNDKVTVGINLAPSAYIWNTTFLNGPMAKHIDFFSDILNHFDIWELFPGQLNLVVKSFLRMICSEVNIFVDFCAFSLHFGYETGQIEPETLQLLFQSSPARCSVKTLVHYAQVTNSAEFKQFDYGELENRKIYGSSRPPTYDIRKITTPTAYFYTPLDTSFTRENVMKMVSLTKNAINYVISYPRFTHIDYLIGKDAVKLVNEPAYQILLKYVT